MSDNVETAVLAGGCFWIVQEVLRHRDGVISSRVGYTGGENDNPTDGTIRVTPRRSRSSSTPSASPTGILEFFFQMHRPDLGEHLVGSVYRSEIFYTSDEQRKVAECTIPDVDASALWPGKTVTEISEAGRFWEAKPEDQDYLQRHADDLHLPLPAAGLEAATPRDRGS